MLFIISVTSKIGIYCDICTVKMNKNWPWTFYGPGCNQILLCCVFYSVTLLQPQSDTPTEQEKGSVNFTTVRRQYRPSDNDTHLTQLTGCLHQQLSLQLSGKQLVRTPGWRSEVGKLVPNTTLPCIPLKSPNIKISHLCFIFSTKNQNMRVLTVSHFLQPLFSVPSPHQPNGLPAAALPTARAQRLWAYPTSPPTSPHIHQAPARSRPLFTAKLRPQQ